jgi:hypothetical protein
MLKKAGVAVALSAAAMLAVSPMAWADDDDDDVNTTDILSGNAVQIIQVQDAICNVNALNDLLNILSPHKNEYNQKKSCNAKNKVSGH